MQNTTADYKIEINKPSRSFECKITIGNNIYTNEDLVNLTLEFTQPQEGFSIGGTISKSLDLTLLNRGDIIYSTSQIKVEIGLKIGSKIEYILMGLFNIDDIEKTDYTTKFTAYDNMIKFETDYFSELGDKPTLQQVVNELSSKTGVEFTGSLPAYTVSKLDGFSCREVLSYVASICGGNALITRDGKFTIKTLNEVEKAIDGSNYFNYTREEVKYKVGQISCQVDENNILSKGSTGTDSMELGFENPWVTETILTEIYNKLNGLSYLGYSMKWQGDLSLDPYDIITVTDVKNVVRKIPILSQKITYTGGLTSEIGAKGETKNKNSFSSSGSTANKVNRAVIEQAIIKEALIEKANIKDVEAVSIRTQTLEAKTAKIEEAIIDVAYIKDLNAINANIQNLIAADATINNALIGKADITELNAVKGTINVLESDTANIKNLLAGNITGESGQLIHLTASNVVIADAVIKNLIASNISAQDLKASTISTNKFSIASIDGGLSIVGPTMQFKDKNNKVRIQMGQDATGNFNFILRGADGTTTLIDHTGIKEKAIADNLIKENMVAADAIGEKQINYSSLITGLNKDTNTSLIKASKVAIDLTGQSLEVSFNSLKSNVDNMEIGGRNLILTSNDEKTYAKDSGIVVSKANDFIKVFKNTTSINSNLGVWKDVVVEPNTEYTVSLKVGHSDDGRIGIGSFISGNNPWSEYGYYNFTANKLFVKTFTTKSGETKIRFFIAIRNDAPINSYLEFINFKLEKGNKATDWTPAPEDVDTKIESNTTAITVAQGKIDGLIAENTIIKGDVTTISNKYTSLKATVDGINTTVASHTSSIGTINTNISGLSGKVTTVENNYASLSQNLEGFKTTVGNTYSTKKELSTVDGKVTGLTSRVSTAESGITQLNNQIKLKVEATDVTEAIDNIKVGGRNLLFNSNDESSYTQDSGMIVAKNSNWIKLTKNTTSTSSNLGIWKDVSVKGNYTYTISFKCRDSNSNSGKLGIGSFISGNNIWWHYGSFILNSNSYFVKTFTTKSNESKIRIFIAIDAASSINSYLEFIDVKVEEGNKATAWTPAPEDIDSAIATVDTKVETTKKQVAEIKIATDSITQRVSSTESTLSTTTITANNALSNANSANSKIDGLEIGGRNLAQQTDFKKDSPKWICVNGATIDKSTGKATLIANGKDCNIAHTLSQRLEPNTTYTLSARFKDNNTIGGNGLRLYISINGSWRSQTVPSNADGVYSFTFITPDSITKDSQITIDSHTTTSGSCEVWNIKLERGDKATDWIPAPEDVDSSIANVQTQVTTTSNKVATIETNLNSITQRVSSTESTVSTHTTQLGTVDSRINTAKNAAISAAATDATSKANNAQSKALADAKSYTNGQISTVNKTITDKVAEIKTTTDSITQRVSSAETKVNTVTANFNNLQVGGRNLAQLTSNSYSSAYTNFTGVTNTCPSLAKVLTDGLSVGDTVTIRLVYKYTNIVATSGQTAKCWIQGNGNSTGWDSGTFTGSSAKTLSGSGEFEFLHSFKITSEHLKNTYWNTSIRHDYVKSGSVQWKLYKVEKGNKATDWSPAPEDIDSSIANVQTQVTTTSNKVATIETNLSSITSRVSSTESSITTINGNVTSLQSRMTTAEQKITPTAITTTISSVIAGGTGSISTTQFVMDKNGLTINNGALIIKNKAGKTVLSSDSTGNLLYTGALYAQVDSSHYAKLEPILTNNNKDVKLRLALVGSTEHSNFDVVNASGTILFKVGHGGVEIHKYLTLDTDQTGTYNTRCYWENGTYRPAVAEKALIGTNTYYFNSVYSRYFGRDRISGSYTTVQAGAVNIRTAYQGEGCYFDTAGYFRPAVNGAWANGNPNYRWSTVYTVNGVNAASDLRLKENVEYIQETNNTTLLFRKRNKITQEDMYNFIKDEFKLASYNYKGEKFEGNTELSYNLGFIAQDLKDSNVGKQFIIPPQEEEGAYSYNMGSYIGVLAGALRIAINKIELLENKIKMLESKGA